MTLDFCLLDHLAMATPGPPDARGRSMASSELNDIRIMESADELDRMYRRIGEFVVVFQFAVARVREIGCLLLDPRTQELASRALRN
jgi:hypothetical protein